MFRERFAEGLGEVVLQGLHFAVHGDVVGIRLGGFARVQFHKAIGDLLDAHLVALMISEAPQRLQRRSVRRALADLERDDLGIENVGHDLPPKFGVRPAAGGADLRRLDAEFLESAQAVVHAKRDAFHRRTRKMFPGERPGADAEINAGSVRHVGRALALEVREQQQAVGASRSLARGGLVLGVRPLEILPDQLGRHGDVHRAEQRQPAVGRVAERGDLALGIDHRFAGAGVDCAARPEAGRDHSRAGVAGADRAHHVIAATGADEHVGA